MMVKDIHYMIASQEPENFEICGTVARLNLVPKELVPSSGSGTTYILFLNVTRLPIIRQRTQVFAVPISCVEAVTQACIWRNRKGNCSVYARPR